MQTKNEQENKLYCRNNKGTLKGPLGRGRLSRLCILLFHDVCPRMGGLASGRIGTISVPRTLVEAVAL